MAVERESERLEPERDPRAHEEVRCLLFFLFFLFVLFEEGNVALQRSVAKPSSYFLFATQEKEEEGKTDPILAVVGQLQFEVCSTTLQS